MQELWNFLKGKKTYFIMLATIAYAGTGWLTGNLTQTEALAFIFGASGLGALRHGVGTSVINIAQQLMPLVLQSLSVMQNQAKAPETITGARKAPIAKLLPFALALALAGALSACATAPGALNPLSGLNDVLTKFTTWTVADAQAASADAHAHNDVIAYTCWDWVSTKAQATGAGPLAPISGLMSGLQVARDIRRTVMTGVSDDFQVHCGPLILDEENVILKSGLMAGITAAGGPAGLGVLQGAVGGIGAGLPIPLGQHAPVK